MSYIHLCWSGPAATLLQSPEHNIVADAQYGFFSNYPFELKRISINDFQIKIWISMRAHLTAQFICSVLFF